MCPSNGTRGTGEPGTHRGGWGADRHHHSPQNVTRGRKRRVLFLQQLSEGNVKFGLYLWLSVELHSAVVCSGSTRHCQDRSDEGARWELDLLSFGRKKHLSPLQLSFQNILLPARALGVLESIRIKCSQSCSIKSKCAFNSSYATEESYSRNTLRRQV